MDRSPACGTPNGTKQFVVSQLNKQIMSDNQNSEVYGRQYSIDDAQSLLSKHLMPPDTDAENFKNELKQCLKENIQHKREIQHLRQLKKDSDKKQDQMQKDLDEAKMREAAEIQKAVKKAD